jgi:hypothetical protein
LDFEPAQEIAMEDLDLLSDVADTFSSELNDKHGGAANDDTASTATVPCDIGLATGKDSPGGKELCQQQPVIAAYGLSDNRDDAVCEMGVSSRGNAPPGTGSAGAVPPLAKATKALSPAAALDFISSGRHLTADAAPSEFSSGPTGTDADTESRESRCLKAGETVDLTPRLVERLEPADVKRLAVDETLEAARRSATFLGEVRYVMQTSTDVAREMKSLEKGTGLTSTHARQHVASGEPAFDVDVDGTPVRFAADAARKVMAANDVEAIVRFVPRRGHFDDYVVLVVRSNGIGVSDGVTSGGRHEIRFTNLMDWHRAVLMILRCEGHEFDLQLTEAISTRTLDPRPALVTNPGDWGVLLRKAIEVLNRIAAGGEPGQEAEQDLLPEQGPGGGPQAA